MVVIILFYTTAVGRQHRKSSDFCCPFTLLLLSLQPLLFFLYFISFFPSISCFISSLHLFFADLFSAAVPATTSMVSNPLNHLALKLESIQIDYNYLNCFTDFNQTPKFWNTKDNCAAVTEAHVGAVSDIKSHVKCRTIENLWICFQ